MTRIDTQALRDAVRSLRRGGLVVYPTETAYALGCDARDADAVAAIYRMKGRTKRKPLALIAADLRMVRRFFRLPSSIFRLLRYWPAPLTIALPLKDAGIRRALGVRDAGVRVSPHPVARALSRGLGAPIVATSANRSGAGACYSARSALRSLRFRIPDSGFQILVLDAGPLPRRTPSTVVVFRRGTPVVVRKGPVRLRKMEVWKTRLP